MKKRKHSRLGGVLLSSASLVWQGTLPLWARFVRIPTLHAAQWMDIHCQQRASLAAGAAGWLAGAAASLAASPLNEVAGDAAYINKQAGAQTRNELLL